MRNWVWDEYPRNSPCKGPEVELVGGEIGKYREENSVATGGEQRGRAGQEMMKSVSKGTSLAVHWLRTHLPMQRTPIRSLVQEDPTCLGQLSLYTTTTGSEHLEPGPHSKRSHCNEKPVHCNYEELPAHHKKPAHSSEDPGQPKIHNKSIIF